MRDAAWLEGYERWFAQTAGIADTRGTPPPPMFTPYTVRGVTLKNRIVVLPMAQYSATDGVVGASHMILLDLGARGPWAVRHWCLPK